MVVHLLQSSIGKKNLLKKKMFMFSTKHILFAEKKSFNTKQKLYAEEKIITKKNFFSERNFLYRKCMC